MRKYFHNLSSMVKFHPMRISPRQMNHFSLT